MNSRRYAMTSLSIVLLAVTIMSVSALGQNAYAGGAGMSLSAEGSGATIDVSGTSDRSDLDVTIVLSSSNGIHDVAQTSISGGSYSATFNVSNLNDGTYTITANQGPSSKYNLSVDVDVSDGTSDSSVSISNRTAEAEEEEVSVEVVATPAGGLSLTAGGVEGSTTIDISGTTDRTGDITLKVIAPNGNVVSVSQISPSGCS